MCLLPALYAAGCRGTIQDVRDFYDRGAFSAKTVTAVKQDIYAKVMMTLCVSGVHRGEAEGKDQGPQNDQLHHC